MDTEKLLNFTCEMGRSLLQNGAEIYRVEESVHLILKSYGYQQTEIFAIPSCIIINIRSWGISTFVSCRTCIGISIRCWCFRTFCSCSSKKK